MTHRLFRLSLIAPLLLTASLALAGGPPTLALKAVAPGSPEAARGFAYSVTATQCGQACTAPVVARAVGLADGRRISKDTLVVPVAGRDGEWLVKGNWPQDGSWLLVVSLKSHGHATALVRVGVKDAEPQVVQRTVSDAEIDALLRGGKRLEA
jgi:hypothetical protein